MSIEGIMNADARVKEAKARLLEAENDKRVAEAQATADEAVRLLGLATRGWEYLMGVAEIKETAPAREMLAECKAFLAAQETPNV